MPPPAHAAVHRLRHCRDSHFFPALLALAFALLPCSARALDPLDTASLVPPRPALHPGEDSAKPCPAPNLKAPLSLGEVVDLALCRNPQTALVWANARAQAALVGVAQGAYLPNVSASLSESRNRTDAPNTTLPSPYTQKSASLTLSYLLYDFGARAATLENARQLLAAAAATQDSTVQSVFLTALQDFYQVQATQAALQASLESEKANRESFNAADARYRVGSATPADKLQAQTALSQATLNRIQAEGNLKIANGTLANVIGLNAQQPVTVTPALSVVPADDFERDIDALVSAAQQRRPDLMAAEAQFKAAQASVEAARAAGRPTISLIASPAYQNTADFPTHTSSLGVSVSIPLFSGFAPTYRVRQAEALAEAKAAQRDQVQLQVALDVWQSYQNLSTATQTMRTTADLLASAEAAQQVALGRYKAGVGSILDVLNAQSALASARQQRVQATYSWNVSRATLAQAMGSLDASLLATLPDAAGAGGAPNSQGKSPP